MKKLSCIVLCAALVLLVATGCGKKDESAAVKLKQGADFSYPVSTGETLKYWYVDYSAGKIKRNEVPLYQEFEKKTGIKVEYLPTASSVSTEQFNLLFASGNLPDIIDYAWKTVPGGAQKMVNEGHIINLNDLVDSNMPNYKKFISSNSDFEKIAKNDDGNYCYIPAFRGDDELLTYMGPIVRQDWLDELNIALPETLDEWYAMLKAFKEKKNVPSPFVCELKYLPLFMSGAFGLTTDDRFTDDFYISGGKVVYGVIQPSYKDALKLLSKWYREGLIDPNIASIDKSTVDAKMTNGQAGASFALTGGGLGAWLTNAQASVKGYNLSGTKYPVQTKGSRPIIGQKDLYTSGNGQVISKQSKNPELAARFLDYFFSDDGMKLYNYGVEGQGHDLVDGKPVIRKELVKDGTLDKYASPTGGIGVQRFDAYSQILIFDQQRQALARWEDTDASKHRLPAITHTDDENKEISKIMTDINTYKNEMFSKFLLGIEDIDSGFQKYVNQINSMGIDKVIKYKDEAVARYQNR